MWYSSQWQVENWIGHVDKSDILKNGDVKASVLATDLPLIGCVILRKAFVFADFVLGHNY